MRWLRRNEVQDQSGSYSRKAWLSLSTILVANVLFAVSTSVWPDTDEDLDQGLMVAPAVVNGDYNGAFITELVVWRPSDREGRSCEGNQNQSEGNWYIIDSLDETLHYCKQWGAKGDIPVPGDYDGDLINDFAVWRPSDALCHQASSSPVGCWYVINSLDGRAWKFPLGQKGDIPVPGDYDGDGITDLAVWRASEGNWIYIPTSDPERKQKVVPLGRNGDIPVSIGIW
jgi:hypothetical protein